MQLPFYIQGRKRSELHHCFIRGAILTALLILLVPLPSFSSISRNGIHGLRIGEADVIGPCAINLYGLPRSFKDSVLPSLIQHVIRPNLKYQCDYFVHFDNVVFEQVGGRNDRLGSIDPLEILEMEEVLDKEHRRRGLQKPQVLFSNTTPPEFEHLYQPLLDRIFSQRNPQGDPIFLPFNHKSYSKGTMINIIKMWHSQESVWNLMESNIQKHYSRVAMLRSDVVYMTPIDIYQTGNASQDLSNSIAVVPNFARFPVNDRMIYGPYDAVKIWAAGRFQRLNLHAEFLQEKGHVGDGLHSERFLNYTIFPAIRNAGVKIEAKKDICFLRARADHSIRFSDCGKLHVTQNNENAVENLLGRPCKQNLTHLIERNLVQLECPPLHSSDVFRRSPGKLWHPGCDPTLPREIQNPPKHLRPRKILFWRPKAVPVLRPICEADHASQMILALGSHRNNTGKIE